MSRARSPIAAAVPVAAGRSLLFLLTYGGSLVSCDDLDDTYPDVPPCFDKLVAHGATLDDDPKNCGKCFHDCGPDNMCVQGECTADRNWALWPIPDLPQTNDNYQVDADVVRDLTTGLEWQRHASIERVPIKEVRAHCTGLDLNGSGWILPTRIELLSIVNYTRTFPAINVDVFPDTQSAEFKHEWWGATARSRDDSPRDQIDFSEGSTIYFQDEVTPYQPVLSHFIRCVRSTAPPKPLEAHYEIERETVLDTQTGLRWARIATPQCTTSDCPPENQINSYEEALQFCDDLVLGEYDDFRVPSLLELHSIVYPLADYMGTVRVDGDAFPDEQWDLDSGFYSSTMYAPSVDDGEPYPWMIKFQTGEAHRDLGATRVRCVRTDE
jgi:Protein of unknown function (DUF1566)